MIKCPLGCLFSGENTIQCHIRHHFPAPQTASVRHSMMLMLVCFKVLGDTTSNEGTNAPSVSSAVLVDLELKAFSPLGPQPPSVLHCGSQCNFKPVQVV